MAQIGTLKIQTSSGTTEIPVYETSDVSNDMLRVHTQSGTGAINLVDPSNAELNQLRIQTQNNGLLAVATSLDTSSGPSLTTDATLNSQTLEITVYEDTDGDGQAENTETVTVSSSGANSHSLSNISGGSGNDYWLEINLSNSNIEKTAVLNSAELEV